MNRIRGGMLAATLAMALPLLAGSGAAAAEKHPTAHARIIGCRPDLSPGVVTRWEFDHVRPDMTRRKVECVFGVPGHQIGSGFWVNGRFHIAVRYPNIDGTA